MEDKEYEWILKHFQQMELRYHTWMNYYSLFNGALLVAYCTLLVSVGKVIEKAPYVMGKMCNNDGVELFSLNCSYWEFLTLIAGLGLFASVCWLLSMRGHVAWVDSWRWALRSKGYEFDHTIYVSKRQWMRKNDRGVIDNLFLYSTVKITTKFIWAVIIAWTLAGIYSVFESNICCGIPENFCGFVIRIVLLLIAVVASLCYGLCKKEKLKSDIADFDLKRVQKKNIP